ncbi:MAG: divergent polysaccharide deacetylase family protein [Xanthobacteraceae bacterium]
MATDDDLSAPLGQRKPKKPRLVIPPLVLRVTAAILGLCLAIFVLWAVLGNDRMGGEPAAVVAVEEVQPVAPKSAAVAPAASPQVKTAPDVHGAVAHDEADKPPGGKTVTIIDGMSGKRQEVVIGQPPPAPVPPAAAAVAAAASPPVASAGGVDQRLVETTRHGSIPKIADDGARPADVYARHVAPGGKTGPRIAIVVSGLGVGASGTTEALARLPGPVTLGFAPYGTDLERWVARARGEGHEVLLQVPMEPFEYPDNDPGPQTLLTALRPEQNVDRLHWFMSRFGGYVGITNFMGARFTATDQALAPVVREAAKRGLIYFDDGSSPRSLTGQLAGTSNAAYAKADVQLDVVPTPSEIDAALARLEALAREHGVAVGVATSLPVSIDRISQWIKAGEARGIVLVPISAVATKPKSS